MPAVPSWAPQRFDLTNPFNGTMAFNVQTDEGLYLLDRSGCSFDITVRSTRNNVPQSDGAILHRRFLTGTEMPLTIILMQDKDTIACDDLLATMLDNLTGALRSLLNAGDNEGRLAWAVEGKATRMLDDVRLFVYPDFEAGGALPSVTVTLDSGYPYAQDLTQVRTPIADGSTVNIINTGTADYFPVFQVNRLNGVTGGSPVPSFTLANLNTGENFVYNDLLPGAIAIPGGHYGEANTFRNEFFEDGDGADLAAGVVQPESIYFALKTGDNHILAIDVDVDVLWAPAWG